MAPVEEMNHLDPDRSNKGASKQRRDQINAEINVLRELLPLPESSRQRLSQLQVMSLSCVYIRKCNVIHKLFRNHPTDSSLPDVFDFFQALTGFMLVTTREGKLVYISENVTDFLGHSMVDMKTQGDSLFDIVDKRDHSTVHAKLMQGGAAIDSTDPDLEEVTFFCRMNMSRTLKRQPGFGDVKVMHIKGHFVTVPDPLATLSSNLHPHHHHAHPHGNRQSQQQQVFVAVCSPLITPDLKENLVLHNTNVFKTVHRLDMTFVEATHMAEHHLGKTSEELSQSSWYSLIHPEDIHIAKEKHVQLVRSNQHEVGTMMTVRMLRPDGSFLWVNVVMHIKQTLLSQTDEPYIVCVNQIISAQESMQIRMQNHMFSFYPGRVQELWGSNMPNGASPSGMPNNSQWVQPPPANSAMPMPGYPCQNMPNFISQNQPNNGYHQHQQTAYPVNSFSQSNSMEVEDTSVEGDNKLCQSGSPYQLDSLVQTDQLKAMLKRKIQGPGPQTQSPPNHLTTLCQPPAKMPKLTLVATAAMMDQKPTAGKLSGVTDRYSNNIRERQQMLQYHQDQVVQVMRASAPPHPQISVNMNGSMSKGRSSYSPVFASSDNDCTQLYSSSTSTASNVNIKVEQVVPDINVPDSYLTPDPSPVSSPQPPAVKSEVMEKIDQSNRSGSSVSILKALEKLASQPQKQQRWVGDSNRKQANASAATNANATAPTAATTKGLPIIDAFDIETFFDQLEFPISKASAYTMEAPRTNSSTSTSQAMSRNTNTNQRQQQQQLPSCYNKSYNKPLQQQTTTRVSSPPVTIKREVIEFDTEVVSECGIGKGNRNGNSRNQTQSPHTKPKDLVVSSTMLQSPLSNSFDSCGDDDLDDLFNCLSDDNDYDYSDNNGLDIKAVVSTSNNTNSKDVGMFRPSLNSESFAFGGTFPTQACHQFHQAQHDIIDSRRIMVGELSPQSNTSGMSPQHDILDTGISATGGGIWHFGGSLDSDSGNSLLESNANGHPFSCGSPVMGEGEGRVDDVFNNVDFFLDSFVPS